MSLVYEKVKLKIVISPEAMKPRSVLPMYKMGINTEKLGVFRSIAYIP
jgi:hypothetical protein